ncbi:MAG: branched-chain amino acid ABC transporter permease [Hyphomicrobiaceae bacterium]
MTVEGLIQALALGILAGSIYGIVSAGLSLVFGVMRLVNFAHGAFMMVAMYIAYAFTRSTGWSVYASIPVVIICLAALGYAVFFVFFRTPALEERHNDQLIISLAVAILIEAVAQQIFTSEPKVVEGPVGGISLGSFVLPTAQLIGFFVAVLGFIVLDAVLNRTRNGRALRAIVADREMARLLGIPVQNLYVTAFVLSVVLAGVAGVVLVAYYPVTPITGMNFVLISFICVLLGGVGDVYGTFVAGLLVGIVQSLTAAFWYPSYQDIIVYLVFVLTVMLRPRGLLGRAYA